MAVVPAAQMEPRHPSPAARGLRPRAPGAALGAALPWPPPPFRPADLGGGRLVVRNTFLHFQESGEEDMSIRSLHTSWSAPALLPTQLGLEVPTGEARLEEGQSRHRQTSLALGQEAPTGEARLEEGQSRHQQTCLALGQEAPTGEPRLEEGQSRHRQTCLAFGQEAPAGEPPLEEGQSRHRQTCLALGQEVPIGEPPSSIGVERRTTVVLRNVPYLLTRDMLVALLNSQGFRGQIDLVYLPMDFKTNQALGYAFVNAVSAEVAIRLFGVFEGFQAWPKRSAKVCSVCWSTRQGLESNLHAYGKLTVMQARFPDAWKPVFFSQGNQVAFPKPGRKAARNLKSLRSVGDAPRA